MPTWPSATVRYTEAPPPDVPAAAPHFIGGDAVRATVRCFAADRCGATSIEYALIAFALCTAIVAGLPLVTPHLIGIFESAAAGFR